MVAIESIWPESHIPNTIRIITIYDKSEFIDGENYPSGDYRAVEVWFDLQKVASYGDEYHDRGRDKAEAFIQGAAFAWKVAYDLDAPKTWWVDQHPPAKKRHKS